MVGKTLKKKLKGQQWASGPVEDGIRSVSCKSWLGCVGFLNEALLDYTSYVFRGHASDTWQLEPTLDRLSKSIALESTQQRHLQAFKYATRGRRGSSPTRLENDNEWWSLGQHNGLATPLLDWSESPYVAAFFAFEKSWETNEPAQRVIYALNRASVERRCKELIQQNKDAAVVSFIRPMTDDNARLITQRGLFTRVTNGALMEEWIKKAFKGDTSGAKLLRIDVPSAERTLALRSLNRMNVNHMSLFPDLHGAGRYCNFALEISGY